MLESELTLLKHGNSFADVFERLYTHLLNFKDQTSEEFLDYANQIRLFVVDFWRNQTTLQPQKDGSFGLDAQGHDQLALCMEIHSPKEMTICKWGLEMDADEKRIPRIEILSSNDINGHPQNVFNIDMHGGKFKVTRTDLRPRMGNAKSSVNVDF